jgi:hypothetical protein
MKGGAAKMYVGTAEALALLRELHTDGVTVPESNMKRDYMSTLSRMMRRGDALRLDLVAHLHRQARPDNTPDLLALHREYHDWLNGDLGPFVDGLIDGLSGR